MKLNKRCRLCQSKKVILLYPANIKDKKKSSQKFTCTNCGFGTHGRIISCHSCGIIYVDEKISQKRLSTYYEVARDRLYFREQKAREETFLRYLRFLNHLKPGKGKLLDVGTNTGLFIKLAKDNGWQATGLEPNQHAVDYAKKNYQIRLIQKPFARNLFPKQYFDVITMWDVIEHFNNPIAAFNYIYRYLKPAGIFAFSTIDPESLLARIFGSSWPWYMEMHRVFFTRGTAQRYLNIAGFSKIIFKSHLRYLSLGYLASRLKAVSPHLASRAEAFLSRMHLSKIVVPYYANDLYECYAVKV